MNDIHDDIVRLICTALSPIDRGTLRECGHRFREAIPKQVSVWKINTRDRGCSSLNFKPPMKHAKTVDTVFIVGCAVCWFFSNPFDAPFPNLPNLIEIRIQWLLVKHVTEGLMRLLMDKRVVIEHVAFHCNNVPYELLPDCIKPIRNYSIVYKMMHIVVDNMVHFVGGDLKMIAEIQQKVYEQVKLNNRLNIAFNDFNNREMTRMRNIATDSRIIIVNSAYFDDFYHFMLMQFEQQSIRYTARTPAHPVMPPVLRFAQHAPQWQHSRSRRHSGVHGDIRRK